MSESPTVRGTDFDPAQAPLTGVSLIEASAGTGKTYNIVRLFVRLLLEPAPDGRVRRTSEILTVTFTRAATEELRERIRRLLAEMALRARGRSSQLPPDPVADEILASVGLPVARERIHAALADFDEAPIYTIHGFCHRALGEFAFESGESFRGEVLPVVSGLMRETALDFWRRLAYTSAPTVAAYLQSAGFTPDTLTTLIQAAIARPEASLPSLSGRPDLPSLAEFESVRLAVVESWKREGATVLALLEEASTGGVLKGAGYSPASLKRLRKELEAMILSPSPPGSGVAALAPLLPTTLASKTAAGRKAPAHPFFEECARFFEASGRLSDELDEYLNHLVRESIAYGRREAPLRKDRLGVLTYEDLLVRLDGALTDATSGPALRAALRRRYRAALVDEFQDTDVVQWRIFRNIFVGSEAPLFLIGDPKQAIYGFRGADLDVYLDAATSATYRHSLAVNHRSSTRLISAFNTLFARTNPFLRQGVAYKDLRAPQPNHTPELTIDGIAQVPLQIRFPAEQDGGPAKLSRTEAQGTILRGVVAEVVELLRLGREGRARIGEHPVRPGDIAVLVRRNVEAEDVKSALERAGVKSVLRIDRDLFESEEAGELLKILRAIENPARGDYLREALVTSILGRTALDLARLEENDAELSDLTLTFRAYRELWIQRGFMHMFQELVVREQISRRLLSYPEGERRMTNLNHLAEVLHREARNRRGSELRLLRGDDAIQAPEEHLIRLESDEDAVQVVTAHLSKGLQYGIVYVPFAWQIRPNTRNRTFCGRPSPDEDVLLLPELCTGRESEELRARMRAAAARLTLEEEVRLLYVALTRARSFCTLVWGCIRQTLATAPAYLLHDRSTEKPDPDLFSGKSDEGVSPERLVADLTELVRAGAGSIEAGPLSDAKGSSLETIPSRQEESELTARVFRGRLSRPFAVHSYTSLQAAGRSQAELPDHGEREFLPAGPSASVTRDAFGFPRGGRTGVFFHRVLERYFGGEREDPGALVEQEARAFGLSDWADVALAMVERTLRVPIPEAPGDSPRALGEIPPEDCLVEVQFYYPEESDFLTGFADLVFRAHGRYYLVDWKTNYLGPSVSAYGPEDLARVMRLEAYDLQYAIYTHALDRYLALRDENYTYAESFGGVLYIFLRGLEDPQPPTSGLYFVRPDENAIRSLRTAAAGRKVGHG